MHQKKNIHLRDLEEPKLQEEKIENLLKRRNSLNKTLHVLLDVLVKKDKTNKTVLMLVMLLLLLLVLLLFRLLLLILTHLIIQDVKLDALLKMLVCKVKLKVAINASVDASIKTARMNAKLCVALEWPNQTVKDA